MLSLVILFQDILLHIQMQGQESIIGMRSLVIFWCIVMGMGPVMWQFTLAMERLFMLLHQKQEFVLEMHILPHLTVQ